jgi:hypothetical protein
MHVGRVAGGDGRGLECGELIEADEAADRCTRLDEVEYFSPEELEEYQRKHPDAKPWKKGEPVTRLGEPFLAVGARAVEYRLAARTVEDFAQFKQYYGLEHDPRLMEPGWADSLIEALASPGASA